MVLHFQIFPSVVSIAKRLNIIRNLKAKGIIPAAVMVLLVRINTDQHWSLHLNEQH